MTTPQCPAMREIARSWADRSFLALACAPTSRSRTLATFSTSRSWLPLATYRRSGEVLLSPVWFEWRDGGFDLVVGRNDFKAQHLRRDPRASVAVYESTMPLRGLELRGTARLLTDGLHELRTRIWQRYMSAEPLNPDETEIRVRIEGVLRAWDFAE